MVFMFMCACVVPVVHVVLIISNVTAKGCSSHVLVLGEMTGDGNHTSLVRKSPLHAAG